MNQKTQIQVTRFDELMEKDRWHANDLGLTLSEDSSAYWFPFNRTHPHWLRQAAKRFVYQQASTKKFSTCVSYLKALSSLGIFITAKNPALEPEGIDRRLMVDYIHELCAVKKLSASSVESYLSSIRTFFEVNVREKWLPLSTQPLIFHEDFPRREMPLPKFIPESVIKQLLMHLPSLLESHQNLVILFLETGRRRGEIFTLPYHCLYQDEAGDNFLKINDRKMSQSRLIPISENCVKHIRRQQAYVDTLTSSKDYLFIRKRKGKYQPMKSRPVQTTLNLLAKEKNIVDDNGCLWHFHFHQFRHYVEFLIMSSKSLLCLNNSIFALSTRHN